MFVHELNLKKNKRKQIEEKIRILYVCSSSNEKKKRNPDFFSKTTAPLFFGKKNDKIDSDRVIDFETRKLLVKIAYALNKRKSQIMSFICNPTWF